MAPELTRRGLLGLSLVALGACTGDPRPATPTTATSPPPPDPLLALLAGREELVASYDVVMATHPDLAGRLGPLRDQTAEQVMVLRLALALPRSSAPSTASGVPTSSGGPTTSGVAMPDPAAARASLLTAVQASGAAAESVCLVTTRERAPLVGSLVAAAAGHALVLS